MMWSLCLVVTLMDNQTLETYSALLTPEILRLVSDGTIYMHVRVHNNYYVLHHYGTIHVHAHNYAHQSMATVLRVLN